MRGRRVALWVGAGVALVAVLLLAAVLIVTTTDWGRERVRSFALDRIEPMVDGEVEIGRVEGNLLSRVRLIDVAIRDPAGRPFLVADTLEMHFALRALLRQRVDLSDVRIVGAVVTLDQPPGEEWNYVRIFRPDRETTWPGRQGWGDWVALEDVTLVDSRVTVRAEWRPPDGATSEERRAALRQALDGDAREHVVKVPGGYQNVMDFRELDGELPRVLVAHPDTAGTSIEVARLDGLIRPFSPPPARVRDFSGDVLLVRDSLFLSGARAVLPGSRLDGRAIYALHSGELLLLARGSPIAFEDLRWIEPRLPDRGGGEMWLRLELGPVVNRVVAWDLDVHVGDATAQGRLDLMTGDTVRFGDTDLRFARVETGLIERLFDVDIPRVGRLTGELALQGPPRALRVDGDVRFDDRAGPSSRVIAEGELGIDPEIRFEQLRLRFSPLQAELVRIAVPELPLRGTIEGTALLTGSPAALDLEADLALRDPHHGPSRIRLAGALDTRETLRLHDMVIAMDPLRLDLLREAVPDLPAGATATGRVTLDGVPSRTLSLDGDIVLDDPATGVSGIGATGELVFDDELRFRGLDLRFSPLQAGLARIALPEIPVSGTIEGTARLNGSLAALDLDADLTLRDPRHGASRVIASGGIDRRDELRFDDLRVRMEPLALAVVRPFAPDLPLGGTLRGTARLDGSPASRIAIRGDVVHEEAGERSSVAGHADVVRGPGGWASFDVRLQPLSLDVAGRFLPGAGLRGSVAGRLQASGDMGDLRIDADLDVAGGGAIRAEGSLDLAGAEPVYDLEMRLQDFNLAAMTWRAPARTDLTGALSARGRGLEPATMRATIDADLADSGIDDLNADRVRLRAALDAGLARVDSSIIRLGGAEAVLDGTFGLIAGRDGVLTYRVAVDSLHAFASWLPVADTGAATPMPTPTITAAADAGADDDEGQEIPRVLGVRDVTAGGGNVAWHYVAADGARVAVNTTRVQSGIERPSRETRRVRIADARAITATADALLADGGAPTPSSDEPEVPLLRAPADSLAGSLRAAGSLRGNVTRFDADGRAAMDELLYAGTYVGSGEADFEAADMGTPSLDITLDAELSDVRTASMAFDDLSVEGGYHGMRGEGTGEVLIVGHGTDATEYRADAEFDLSLDRKELRLADLVLRYDTVTWRTARPGVVSWAGNAIEVAQIDIVNDRGGRVRLEGRLPVDGSGDMDVLVENVEFAPVVALLQLDEDIEGRLDLDAHVTGTLERPRVDGRAQLVDARLDGARVPDVHASFAYEGPELTADAVLLHEGREMATAEARVPVDLSLVGGGGPRLLPGELTIDVRADSLPIEAIPALSEQLADARGRVRGDLAIRGTTSDPVVSGRVDIDLGSVRIVPLDVRLEEVAGALRLEGNVLRVDSLVARSGGPIRMTGEIDLGTRTDPGLALAVETRETLVIDTDDISLELDADLTVGGTLAAVEVGGEVRTRGGVIRIPPLTDLGAIEVVSLHSPVTSGRIEEEFLEDQLRQQHRRPLLDRLHLDIALQVDRDVWLRSTEVNVEIYTPPEVGPLRVRLSGPGTLPVLEGTLNTDRGQYEFMSRRFELTRGAATFVAAREINPIIQVAAEHQVRLPGREAFEIRVLLGGTLRDMEITLESTAQPPIAQTELLSYLAFGRDAASLLYRQGSALSAQGGDAGDLVGNVAGLATQQLGTIALDAMLGDLERELAQDLHVDVFRITPADLPPDMFTGSYADLLRSTEIEAGRYFSSRLFVAAQVNTGITGSGLRFEYAAPFGLQWRTSWASRWMPMEPTLTEQDPRRAGILGSFLLREWRF